MCKNDASVILIPTPHPRKMWWKSSPGIVFSPIMGHGNKQLVMHILRGKILFFISQRKVIRHFRYYPSDLLTTRGTKFQCIYIFPFNNKRDPNLGFLYDVFVW
ncbi:hypothetical protein WP3W18E01_24860 [Raoultella ornithinolytica]|nr:hypothetical protein WP3W18E01_24860 [Raoultella ornithinolytica]